jgi:hypothetical protein
LLVGSLVFCLEFPPNYLKREKLTEKKLIHFTKLQFFNNKIYIHTKKPFGTWQIGVLVYFIIQELKFFKVAQLFLCFTFSGINDLRRLRGNLNHITQKVSQSTLKLKFPGLDQKNHPR